MTSSLTVLNCCAPVSDVQGIAVRAAQATDLENALALLRESQLPTEGVADYFQNGYAVVERNGKVLAVAGMEVHGADALLRSVAVARAYRGQGLGELIVQDRLAWARAHAIRDVYLLTTTASEFFPRFGFQRVDRAAAPDAMQQSAEFASICGSESTAMRVSIAAGDDIRAVVRERYAAAARASADSVSCACCGDSKTKPWNPVTSDLYEEGETQGIPAGALLASLGCGNPTALAELKPGETVLDLGSGGGIDVLLSARRVGPSGKAYGLDMTDDMLALARENQKKAGATNVEFLKGEIENVPLPDNSVDVVISNCVINLSADKRKVLEEAHRVLRPGGRFAVSDIVVRGEMPAEIRRNAALWTGCVAGALEEQEYLRLLREAGFSDASIEPVRIYGEEDILSLTTGAGLRLDESVLRQLDGKFMSAFVRASR